MKKSFTLVSVAKFSKITGVHVTLNHTGKMSGMQSISTSVLANPTCQKRRNVEGSICSHCFAANMMKMYGNNFEKCFSKNLDILTGSILEVLPQITSIYFRLESFGDLANWIQAANYLNIARMNPTTKFALWTKNPRFIAEAIRNGFKKPANLQIIYSSLFVNRCNLPKGYDFIDKVFTVYDKETAKDININCGARSCFTCHRCYSKNPKGVKIQFINEILK